MKKNDGGPAFPRAHNHAPGMYAQPLQTGMSLRDYFAAKALNLVAVEFAGSISDAEKELGVKPYVYEKHYPLLLAKRAYALADAMLAEREKEAK